jgi:5,10-methylenetetrahydromethanopterin reductase
VLASSLASLSAETDGRVLCGIGRGDSSLAHIGKGNASTAQLRTFIERLRGYLNGEPVDRDGHSSQLRWLDSYGTHPVPIDIACTGPKTIQMAVEVGDRISFAVGSAPERLQWAIETAETHLSKINRPRNSIQLGAYINLVCDENEQTALSLGKLIAGMVAHFAGLKHAPTEHLPPRLRAVAEHLQSQYDMARHAQEEGSHLALIDEDFVDWFSICGPPQKCIERLEPLINMGLEHIYQLGGTPIAHPHGARQIAMVEQAQLFATDVIPHFR